LPHTLIPVSTLGWTPVDTTRDSFEQPELPLADWETEIYECLILLLGKHGVQSPLSEVIYGRELGGKGHPPGAATIHRAPLLRFRPSRQSLPSLRWCFQRPRPCRPAQRRGLYPIFIFFAFAVTVPISIAFTLVCRRLWARRARRWDRRRNGRHQGCFDFRNR